MTMLNHWSLGNVAVFFKVQFSESLYRVVAWALTMKVLTEPH